jgi:hypothetical protein
MTTTTALRTTVIIGKCKRCSTLTKVERELFPSGFPVGGYALDCSACHYPTNVREARTNDRKKCDARCTGATGPACSCSCGGRNHGGGWAA